MQIVGLDCKSCGKAITFEGEGIGCLRCGVAFHRRCLRDGTICPQCAEDMDEASTRKRVAETEAEKALLRTGRTQTRICLALLAALVLFNLLVPILLGSSRAFAIQPWLQSLVIALLCYLTYIGQTWARIVLTIPVLMTLLGYIILLQRKEPLNAAVIAYAVFGLGCSLSVLWLLIGSHSVRYFLASQRAAAHVDRR